MESGVKTAEVPWFALGWKSEGHRSHFDKCQIYSVGNDHPVARTDDINKNNMMNVKCSK